jgi:hypothetical protein
MLFVMLIFFKIIKIRVLQQKIGMFHLVPNRLSVVIPEYFYRESL